MRNRFRPLVALLLLTVLQNGVATPWSAAPDVVPPADMGMTHQGHDGTMDRDAGGHPGNHAGPGCCDSPSCDCGCTATPAFMLSQTTVVRDWPRAGAARAPDATGIRPAATGGPFRPPA